MPEISQPARNFWSCGAVSGAPKLEGCRARTPPPPIESKNKTDFVDMSLVHVLRDLPFNQNFFSWLDNPSGPRPP